MKQEEILVEFDRATEALLHQLGSFSSEQLNMVPAAGGWNAGQVGEHILKANGGVPQLFQGNTETTDRNPDEKSAILSSILLDFTTKMQSPPFAIPDAVTHNKAELLQALQSTMHDIRQAAATQDLSVVCSGAELPNMGTLTKLEWVNFVTYHTQRHTNQIKNIYSSTAQ